jgi:hypothetical protein
LEFPLLTNEFLGTSTKRERETRNERRVRE